MATVFISDTFTEASDVDLAAHTPDVGGAWSEHPSYTTNGTVVASEDRFRGNSSTATSLYLNATTPPSANYEVQWVARQTTVGTGSRCGAAARYDASANSGYLVYYDGTEWQLVSAVAGVFTVLATWNGSETANTDYAIRWYISGEMHEITFDGTLRMSARSAAHLSAGRIGVLCRLNGRVDNFIAQTLDPVTLRLAQTSVEVFSTPTPDLRLAQSVVEVFSRTASDLRLAQTVVEVFSQNIETIPLGPAAATLSAGMDVDSFTYTIGVSGSAGLSAGLDVTLSEAVVFGGAATLSAGMSVVLDQGIALSASASISAGLLAPLQLGNALGTVEYDAALSAGASLSTEIRVLGTATIFAGLTAPLALGLGLGSIDFYARLRARERGGRVSAPRYFLVF